MLMQSWQVLETRIATPEAALADAWRDLTRRSAEPAGLCRPELLMPLLQIPGGASLHTVWSGGELLLALPVVSRRLPPLAASWLTPLTPGGAPHLDGGQGAAAIAALLRKIRQPLLLQGVPATGAFMEQVRAGASQVAVIAHWERAALRPQGDFKGWLAANHTKHRRNEWRRQKARLADLGRLEVTTLQPGGEAAPFAAALLDLEQAGWKGERGTAIKSQPPVAAAFERICQDLHRQGCLRFWQISLDGRAIASLYAIVEGDRAWLGKIAYDETLHKYSPGVLVILEASECLFSGGNIALADSCAIPNHPMIDHLWRDRIAIADVMVAGPNVSAARFSALVAAEHLRRRSRNAARDLYYKLRGRKRS